MTINIPSDQLAVAVSIFLIGTNVVWSMANFFYSYTLRKGETSRIRAIVKSNGELVGAVSRLVGTFAPGAKDE